MTPRFKGLLAGTAALCWATALACGPAAAATAQSLYYERALMVAADGRCRLFEPKLGAALAAAEAQARGAALRSGDDEDSLRQTLQNARARADSTPCRSADLTLAARRVRDAFAGYSRLQQMVYPGDLSSWRAERAVSASTSTWRLSQPIAVGGDRAIFGLAGSGAEGTSVTAVASFADGAWPYAARLVVRDPARAPQPQLRGASGRPAGRPSGPCRG